MGALKTNSSGRTLKIKTVNNLNILSYGILAAYKLKITGKNFVIFSIVVINEFWATIEIEIPYKKTLPIN